MRMIRNALFLCSLLLATPALGQTLAFSKSISLTEPDQQQHPLNAGRFILLGELDPMQRPCCWAFRVLDTRTRRVHEFAFEDSVLRPRRMLDGRLLSVAEDLSRGYALFPPEISGPRREGILAELDLAAGTILRTSAFPMSWESLRTFGTTSDGRYAFWSYAPHTDIEKPPVEIVLMRAELTTLAVREVARISLPSRPPDSNTGIAKAAASRSMNRFAFAEYAEQGVPLSPPQRIFVVDAVTGAHFSAPAPVTPYGLVFSHDDNALYVGSCETGMVEKLDLRSRHVVKSVSTLPRLHELLLSPSGRHLFALSGIMDRYQVYSLPDMTLVGEHRHDRRVSGFGRYFGGGAATVDGSFFTWLGDASQDSHGKVRGSLVLTRVVESP